MKKFILVVFTKNDSNELSQSIALNLSPLVDSPHLKFFTKNGSLIFHFATEISKDEIYDYVNGVLFGDCKGFILTELTDNMTLSFPKDILEHLLDLEKDESPDVKYRINLNEDIYNNEEFDEDFVSLMIDEIKKTTPKPSLDFLLEKIKEKGLRSLSQFEKDALKEYSK